MEPVAQPKFHFEYPLTLEDFVAYNLYTNMKSPSAKKNLRKSRRILAGSFAVVFVLLLLRSLIGAEPTLSSPFFLCAYVLIAGLFLLVVFSPPVFSRSIKRSATKLYQKNENACPKRMALSFFEEKIREVSEINESAVAYDKLLFYHVDEEAVYFYVTPVNAYILPRRAIGKEQEDALFAFLREKIPEGKKE